MWEYFPSIITSLFVALSAVWFSHWLARKSEYRKAIRSLKDEITTNIQICDQNCKLIDSDLNFLMEGKMLYTPYLPFNESAWEVWKAVILRRNSKVISKIQESYFYIAIVNNLLRRIEELKFGIGPIYGTLGIDIKETRSTNINATKGIILGNLLPQLKDIKEFLEKES